MEDTKVPRRVDYAAGIKAGFVAGLVSIAFFLPADLFSLYLRDLAHGPFLWRIVVFFAETDIPYAIVIGLIIGIVFAATHNRFLEGFVLEVKGMMYGIGYWLLVILPYVLLQPLARQFYFSSLDFPISIAGYLIFGLVLGNLYKRFSSRQPIH